MEKSDDKDESGEGLWKDGAWKLYISRALTAWGDRLWVELSMGLSRKFTMPRKGPYYNLHLVGSAYYPSNF